MSSNHQFENEEMWAQYGLTPDYRDRLQLVLGMIPDNTHSLLDVGCGKGDIINAAGAQNPSLCVVGTDAAMAALDSVEAPVVTSALPLLPFADESFDLVLCLQVLEHIPESDFADALRELERAARHHIIVGVPYEENLQTKQVLCAHCGFLFHVDGHVRSFSRARTAGLFQHFEKDREELVGALQKRSTRAATWVQHHVAGKYYAPPAVNCPRCEGTEPRARRFSRPRLVRRTVGLAQLILNATQKARPYWLISRYRRTHA